MPNNQEHIDRICKYRNVPNIKKGTACQVGDRKGQIWGGNSSANFNVKFDDGQIRNCHPGWKMRIFNDDGSILYESKDGWDYVHTGF